MLKKQGATHEYTKKLISLAELILVLGSLTLAYIITGRHNPPAVYHLNPLKYALVALLAYIAAIEVLHPIFWYRTIQSSSVIRHVASTCAFHLLLFLLLLYAIKDRVGSREFMFWYILILFSLVLTLRLTIRAFIQHMRSSGHNIHNVVLIGSVSDIEDLFRFLCNNQYGMHIIGIFTDSAQERCDALGIKRLGGCSSFVSYLHEHHDDIDDVYYALSPDSMEEMTSVYSFCDNNLIRFYAIPSVPAIVKRIFYVEHMGDTMLLTPRHEPLSYWDNRLLKRLVDIICSAVFLLTVFPLIYVIVAIIIKIQSPGPVFFTQKRTGWNNQVFNVLKFRSMHLNKDADIQQATKDDPRKFPFGDFIRRTNIDELPQFINVLIGNMSMVGPRPHMLRHTEDFARMVDKYNVRLSVKPGITGWAQVQGFRGETKTLEQIEDRVKADVWYIENWSLWLDFRIILKTILSTLSFKNKNAY